MPTASKRKTDRQSWSQEGMELAIIEVMSGRMGYKKASKAFNVPQSTLEDRIRKTRTKDLTPAQAATKDMGSCTTVFSKYQKVELVNHILMTESRLSGLALTDFHLLIRKYLNTLLKFTDDALQNSLLQILKSLCYA